MKVRLASAARSDLREAVAWIRRDSPRAAAKLVGAIQQVAVMIGEHPEIGVMKSDWTDLPFRFVALTGYPYVVVYDTSLSPLVITRIVHTSRDLPSALKSSQP
jgi:toxin ParE1/3/4